MKAFGSLSYDAGVLLDESVTFEWFIEDAQKRKTDPATGNVIKAASPFIKWLRDEQDGREEATGCGGDGGGGVGETQSQKSDHSLPPPPPGPPPPSFEEAIAMSPPASGRC